MGEIDGDEFAEVSYELREEQEIPKSYGNKNRNNKIRRC